jgi:hypothetical protein
MWALSKDGVLPKAVVATLVGVATGGVAAVWSLRQPAASANASAARAPAASTTAAAGSAQSTAQPAQIVEATEPVRARANAASPSAADDPPAEVLQRARTLARRPDVSALMALRDDVLQRATERGTASSSSVKGELDEIDLRLNEARTLRLKLDAEELRKSSSNRSR